jgi:hypothetical protein
LEWALSLVSVYRKRASVVDTSSRQQAHPGDARTWNLLSHWHWYFIDVRGPLIPAYVDTQTVETETSEKCPLSGSSACLAYESG